MTEPTVSGVPGIRTQGVRRFRKMAMMAAALAGVGLLAATGFAFLQTNGSATTSIQAGGISGAANEFADVVTSGAPPTAFTNWAASNSSTAQAAVWQPVVGQVVPVKTPGDVGIIDATGTTGNVLVTLVLSNAASLSADYSYVNLPIVLKQCTLVSTTCTWNAVTADANSQPIGDSGVEYLTLSNGYLSFLVAGGSYYEVTIPTGGSFYTISTGASGGTLSPSYLINVQSAG